jgi:hypothetical protein
MGIINTKKGLFRITVEDQMKKIRILSFFLFLMVLCCWLLSSGQETLAYQKISGKAIFDQAKYLSSEKFEGRETFTDEEFEAGCYIAGKFKDYGLKPVDPQGGYCQVMEMDCGVVGLNNQLNMNGRAFQEGMDFRAAAVGTGTVESQVVFVGYGITTKGYDSYAGVDVCDKIVMVMEGKLSKKGPEFGIAPFHDVLVYNAIHHGAAGMLFAEGTSPQNRKWPIPARYAADSMKPVLERAQALGLIRVDDEAKQAWRKFPLVYITQEVADFLLAERGWTSAGLKRKIDESGQPLPFALGHRVHVQTDVTHSSQKTMNIVGLIEGGDPTLNEETVIIGAHYDHIGRLDARQPEQIAFGADDNASGTAALMEIARVLAKSPIKPKRSILLIAFTGEEKGGLGSQLYLDHPLRPLSGTKAMFNMDMIGRNDSKKIGIFSSQPDLMDLSREIGRRLEIAVEPLEAGYAESSDHGLFLAKNIPVIFYYDGGGDFAHKATDTWDQLSAEKMECVARLCFLSAWALADQD